MKKKITLIITVFSLIISLSASAQKQKKTYDAEKFAKKIRLYMSSDLIGKWMPDEAARKYIAEKSGMSEKEVESGIEENLANIKIDAANLISQGIGIIVGEVEVKIIEESPIKIADLLLHCSTKYGDFIITLQNCIQTDVSWYLGDAILTGDAFDKIVEENNRSLELSEGQPTGMKLVSMKNAEAEKRDLEESKIIELQSKANHGKKIPGWYITLGGEKREGLLEFEPIEQMTDNNRPLKLTLTKDEDLEKIPKDELRVFYANSRLYTPITIEGKRIWAINVNQGAIRGLRFPKFTEASKMLVIDTISDSSEKLGYRIEARAEDVGAFWSYAYSTYKLDEPVSVGGRENLANAVSDYEDLSNKIRNKEKGYKKNVLNTLFYYDLMFEYYNKWYDEQNPGAITYYPMEATYKVPVAQHVQSAAEVAMFAAYDTAYYAPKQIKFEGRPTTAVASIASEKPEVRVKKESFIDRLNRIKADGNKVGVLVRCKNLVVNPKDFGEGIKKVRVAGTYGPLEGIDVLAETTAKQLNSGFGVDVFEPIDYSLIPVKEGKYNKMDDWWSTKYKIIVFYDLTPWYNAFYVTNEESGKREFKALMVVDSEVIIMAAEQDKPEKLKYVTASPKSWGTYSKTSVGANTNELYIIQHLKAIINPPSDQEIVQKLIKSQKDKVDKLIKKKSK
ncbi:MAG: hypothetical protein L3J29_08015 [Cyclobacteriaceae bacterium]|nr:hypothetical protein [Cyclobacteriaceae bacterium]